MCLLAHAPTSKYAPRAPCRAPGCRRRRPHKRPACPRWQQPLQLYLKREVGAYGRGGGGGYDEACGPTSAQRVRDGGGPCRGEGGVAGGRRSRASLPSKPCDGRSSRRPTSCNSRCSSHTTVTTTSPAAPATAAPAAAPPPATATAAPSPAAMAGAASPPVTARSTPAPRAAPPIWRLVGRVVGRRDDLVPNQGAWREEGSWAEEGQGRQVIRVGVSRPYGL